MKLRNPWLTPTITPHRAGVMNKFGGIQAHLHQPDFDGVAIEPLLERYGSPLFVISERTLRENVRRLKRAFATRWPRVRHGWSYKTNYLGAVCNVLHQEGSWAEVVSDFEYEKARSLGVPGSRIIFNGPLKSARILEQAIQEGAAIHIDHLDELYTIEQIAMIVDEPFDSGLATRFLVRGRNEHDISFEAQAGCDDCALIHMRAGTGHAAFQADLHSKRATSTASLPAQRYMYMTGGRINWRDSQL